ncbi:lachesin-like [Chelonus insularis]|uniref:lachesin-like n=1 Tax=Chelonus insularis TaxID=460826 RepID=UPI00158E5B2E|nr:lachesin-like [Chelonus insularis]
MFFILLSVIATLTAPIFCSLQLPESGFSNDPLFRLTRPDIYENTTTDILANVGDSVQFECYASGTPGANVIVEWSRPEYINLFQQNEGNLRLPNGEKVYRGNILSFPSVKPEHAGSYICRAYEEHTLPSSRSYLLSLKSKPSIRSAGVKKIFQDNNVLDAIELSAEASAVPQGEIIWYKNNQVLSNSYKYQILIMNYSGSAVLTISTKDSDYHGTYKFFIQNELGQAEYSFEI